jgi:hypothetical protein
MIDPNLAAAGCETQPTGNVAQACKLGRAGDIIYIELVSRQLA